MAKRLYGNTESRYATFVKNGRGQGVGSEFKPWLQVNDFPSHGRSSRIWGDTAQRAHHLFSDHERAVFQALDHAQEIIDIREQFPLCRERTIEIAEEIEARHPRDKGVLIVMTTDFLLSVMLRGSVSYIALTVKPATELEKSNVIEKLEIERRYWAERNVPWHIVTNREMSKPRERYLQWLHGRRSLEHFHGRRPGFWEAMCDRLEKELLGDASRSLPELLNAIESSEQGEPGDGFTVLRHMLASHRLRLTAGDHLIGEGPASQLEVADVEASVRHLDAAE